MNKLQELRKIKELLDDGIITTQEFNDLKEEILGLQNNNKEKIRIIESSDIKENIGDSKNASEELKVKEQIKINPQVNHKNELLDLKSVKPRGLFIVGIIVFAIVSFLIYFFVSSSDFTNSDSPEQVTSPLNGIYEKKFETGQLQIKGSYKDGMKIGDWKEWQLNDYGYNLKEESFYKFGIREGTYKSYWFEGSLEYLGDYYKGVKQGKWELFSPPNNKLWHLEYYHDGKPCGTWKIFVIKGTDLTGEVIETVYEDCQNEGSEKTQQEILVKTVGKSINKLLTIKGKDIWVRDSPKTGEVIFKLNDNDNCVVLDSCCFESIGGNSSYWYKIDFKGQKGWVFGSQTKEFINNKKINSTTNKISIDNPKEILEGYTSKILSLIKSNQISKIKQFIKEDSFKYFYWEITKSYIDNSTISNLTKKRIENPNTNEYEMKSGGSYLNIIKKYNSRNAIYKGKEYFPAAGFGGGSARFSEDYIVVVPLNNNDHADMLWFEYTLNDNEFSLSKIGYWESSQ